MAFDRPLEADRVDNLSLLSSFVRAPILGPVMWVLGKNILPGETDKVENKNNNDAHQLIDDVSPVKTTSSLMRKNSFTLQNSNERYPDLAGTSISDIVNDSSIDEMDGKNSNNNNIHIRRSFVMNNEEAKLNDPLSHPLQKLKKKTRKMSWSDESGQSLVEYYDMVSLTRHFHFIASCSIMEVQKAKTHPSRIRKRFQRWFEAKEAMAATWLQRGCSYNMSQRTPSSVPKNSI